MSAVAPLLADARVLDLFAGSGALGLEALSRGAHHVTFVESAPRALRILERNIADLGVPTESFRVVRMDAIRFATGLAALEYDLAFADPPYGKGYAARLAGLFASVSFARLLCIEHARGEPIEVPGVARSRRYGDTVLTFLEATDEAERIEAENADGGSPDTLDAPKDP